MAGFLVTPDGTGAIGYFSQSSAQLAEGPTGLWRSALDGPPDVVELNAPFPTEVVGDVSIFDAHNGRAVYLADQDTAGVVELYGVPVAGGADPVRLNGPLVPHGDVGELQLSLDGRWVAFLADAEEDGKPELYGVPSDGSAPAIKLSLPFPTGYRVDFFAISPDGRTVVYHDTRPVNLVRSVPITGGTVSNIAQAFPPYEVTPDSAYVLFHPTSTFSLASVPILGGTVSPLDGGRSVVEHRVTPDAARVVYRAHGADGLERLYSVPIEGGVPLQLHGTPVAGGEVVQFALTGDRAVFRADMNTDERFLCLSVPVDGSTAPLVLNGPLAAGGDVLDLAVDRRGTSVAYLADQEVNGDFGLYSVPLGGGASVRLLDASDSLGFRQVPGGRRVLFATGSGLSSIPVLGGQTKQVALFDGPARYELTSDGRHVVFSDLAGMHIAPVTGGATTTLAAPVQRDLLQSFVLDGPAVVFASETDGVRELYASVFHRGARSGTAPTGSRTR